MTINLVVTFVVLVLGLKQPELVIVKMSVATAARAREERVRKDRAASVEWIRIAVAPPANTQHIVKNTMNCSKKIQHDTFNTACIVMFC